MAESSAQCLNDNSQTEEYLQRLRKWHENYNQSLAYIQWTTMMSMYTWNMTCMYSLAGVGALPGLNAQPHQPSARGVGVARRGGFLRRIVAVQRPAAPAYRARVLVLTIPPVWKRAVAEFIDFFILFVLKMGTTYLAINHFRLFKPPRYRMPLFQDFDETTWEQITELLIWGMFYRCAVSMYEALCTQNGVRGQLGGATVGKRIMGLRVVRCGDVIPLANNRVKIIPTGNLGFSDALVRAVTKNFSVAVMPLASATVFYFKYRRALHDVLAKSIVIEAPEED